MIFRLPFKSTPSLLKSRGFTLIEILASIAILSALTVVSLTSISGVVDDARFTQTVREIEQLRNALVGETQRLETGLRKNYGYLGDMGALPTTSQGLDVLSSLPTGVSSWAIQSSYGIGVGWRGPYISNTFDTDYFKDAWGNDYIYANTGAGATITSLGGDGAAGGTGFNQDIVVNIPVAVTQGKLLGYVVTGSGDLLGADQIPFSSSAEIYLYYPDGSGGITSMSTAITALDLGKYSFSSVPLGYGSVMVFSPTSAVADLTLGPSIVEINKSATAAVPVAQDPAVVFGASSACSAGENFSVGSGSFSSSTGAKTISFIVRYPANYTWLGPFAYEHETNGTITQFDVTNTATVSTETFRYSATPAAIVVGGDANISATTASSSYSISGGVAFLSNTDYRLTFTYSAGHWSDGHTHHYYRIGCKYVRAHPGM